MHALFGQTTGSVAITAGFFALGAYVGRDLSSLWTFVGFIAAFACLIGPGTDRHAAGSQSRTASWNAATSFCRVRTARGSVLPAMDYRRRAGQPATSITPPPLPSNRYLSSSGRARRLGVCVLMS